MIRIRIRVISLGSKHATYNMDLIQLDRGLEVPSLRSTVGRDMWRAITVLQFEKLSNQQVSSFLRKRVKTLSRRINKTCEKMS